MRWALLFVSALVSSCATGRVPRVLGEPPPAVADLESERNYQTVLEKFTSEHAVYDNLRGRVVLFGGYLPTNVPVNDTWEYGTDAIAELGYTGMQGEDMVVVENTSEVHNVLVCTLCSCYPWPTLGLPPVWYKSAPYRSRVVIDPRGVLKEFGLELADATEVRVWDSTSEVRYMVLPERPPGTEHLNEDELAALVTRDAMIGVTKVTA